MIENLMIFSCRVSLSRRCRRAGITSRATPIATPPRPLAGPKRLARRQTPERFCYEASAYYIEDQNVQNDFYVQTKTLAPLFVELCCCEGQLKISGLAHKQEKSANALI